MYLSVCLQFSTEFFEMLYKIPFFNCLERFFGQNNPTISTRIWVGVIPRSFVFRPLIEYFKKIPLI